MSFIVNKKKTVISTQHVAVFFLSHISAIFGTNNTKYSLQITILL